MFGSLIKYNYLSCRRYNIIKRTTLTSHPFLCGFRGDGTPPNLYIEKILSIKNVGENQLKSQVSPQLKGDKLCSWLGRICTYADSLESECLPHPPFCYTANFSTMELTTKLVVVDLNHRSQKQQIYSLPHLTTLETTIIFFLLLNHL